MAKKAYIGVDGVARKVKKGYVGVLTDIPIYSEETQTAAITDSNISEFFDVTNGSSYYFAGSGDTFTSNNNGVNSSTATTVLTAKQDISALSFNYSYSSEENYDKFTLKVAGTTVENAVSGATTSKSYSGSLTAGKTIEFTYAKDSSQSKNDDKCTFSGMVVTATAQVQVGTETKSLARKIKKAYIGIGGVARPCFSGGLEYYGEITPLSVGRSNLAAANVGRYALFGGGYEATVNEGKSTVDAYDESLTRTIPTELSYQRSYLAAAHVGSYALFGGGYYGSGRYGTVDAYDESLTRKVATSLKTSRGNFSATTVGGYALFGGGLVSGGYSSVVDAYDESLTRTNPSSLWHQRGNFAATTVGNYALFGGGDGADDVVYNTVDSYDTSLTCTRITSLSLSRYNLAAANVGNYALFGGGYGSSLSAVVDAYDESLTRTTITELSAARENLAAVGVGNYALFGGGSKGAGTAYSWADAYDESLTRTTITELSKARGFLAAAAVGNYALFGGGYKQVSAVDVYTAD